MKPENFEQIKKLMAAKEQCEVRLECLKSNYVDIRLRVANREFMVIETNATNNTDADSYAATGKSMLQLLKNHLTNELAEIVATLETL